MVGHSRAFGPQGLTSFDDLPEWRTAAVAYAGPWAQARWAAGRRPTVADLYWVLGAAGCAAADSDAMVLSRNGGTSAGAEVRPLLERCWGAVAKVAGHLWQDGEIFPGDVHAALGLSHDPATRAVELSMIRSGAAPGSFTVTMPGHRRGSGRRWWLLDNLAPHRRSPRPRPTTHQTPDSDLDADREP